MDVFESALPFASVLLCAYVDDCRGHLISSRITATASDEVEGEAESIQQNTPRVTVKRAKERREGGKATRKEVKLNRHSPLPIIICRIADAKGEVRYAYAKAGDCEGVAHAAFFDAANINSSAVVKPSLTKTCQYADGILSRAIHDLTPKIVVPVKAATLSGPASRMIALWFLIHPLCIVHCRLSNAFLQKICILHLTRRYALCIRVSTKQLEATMNAPANIPTIQRLAAQIVTGDYSGLPRVDHQLYKNSDWQAAAQYALDGDDYAELADMVAREEAHDHFVKQGEAFSDRWAGFGNWFEQIGFTMFPQVAA